MVTLIRGLFAFSLSIVSVSALAQVASVDEMNLDDRSVSMLAVGGLVDNGLAKQLNAKLQMKLKSGQRTAILLTSNGGVIEQFHNVGNAILKFANAYYKRHGKTTLLVFHQECSSACTFLAGYLKRFHNPQTLEIVASNSTEFLFHAPRQSIKGHFVPFTNAEEFERVTAILYAAYLNVGINGRWLQDNKSTFLTANAETTYTAAQLCRADVGFLPAQACVPQENLFMDVETALGTPFTYFSKSWKK